MVVPVFITNCQVSLKPKIGPVTAHTIITSPARAKVTGRPAMCAVHLAKCVNQETGLLGDIILLILHKTRGKYKRDEFLRRGRRFRVTRLRVITPEA